MSKAICGVAVAHIAALMRATFAAFPANCGGVSGAAGRGGCCSAAAGWLRLDPICTSHLARAIPILVKPICNAPFFDPALEIFMKFRPIPASS
jgi:hypothetical protein